ncbi:MAG: tetratricopeptide repeat protein [Parachlamydia sp.]|nr:tetratricopeptide repeat protein [Parachlamydia sp.]
MALIKAERGQSFFVKQYIVSQLLEEKTPQEIWGIGPEKIEQMFEFACDLYDEKRYKDAADLFLLLTTLNPHRFNFWKNLGFSSQMQSEFAAAALAYECAFSIDPRTAELYPYYLRCLCELKRREQALVVLTELLDKEFDESPEDLAAIRSQCESIVKASLELLKGG